MAKPTPALLLLLALASGCCCSAAAPANTGPADASLQPQQQHGRSLTGFLLAKWAASQHYKAGGPVAATPTPSPSPAAAPPAVVPGSGGGKFGLINDLFTALRCQKVYAAKYNSSPDNLRAALGASCQPATLNPIQCCTDSVALLNGPDLRGCICNQLVYNQLCGQVNVAGLTCATLFPTLQACGLQC